MKVILSLLFALALSGCASWGSSTSSGYRGYNPKYCSLCKLNYQKYGYIDRTYTGSYPYNSRSYKK
jgi:uncharacterized protein YceK